jgi:hypothetical protein
MSTLFFHRFDVSRQSKRHDLLLAFMSTNILDEADFRDSVNRQIERDLVPDEILVVVRNCAAAETVERFNTSETLIALKERIGGHATISIRPFGSDGKQLSPIVVHGSAPLRLPVERFVRRTITKIVRERHGFVDSAGSYHFALPSLRHTQRFIRISNIIADSAEISFIAFGLLPYISKDVSIIYVDTPTLFPVVSALSDHLRAFDASRPVIVAENFRSYEGYRTSRYSTEPENVVLISASASGRLAQLIEGLAGFQRNQFVHLLYFGLSDDLAKVVCNLKVDSALNPQGFEKLPDDFRAGDCPLCTQGSHAIPLVGDHFELPGPQPIPLVIGRGDQSPRFPELVERIVGYGALQVGFGRSNEGIARHFEVSPPKLLKSHTASGRLEYVLHQVIPASIATLVCLNEQSKPFVQRVQKHIEKFSKSRPKIVAASQLTKINTSDREGTVVIVASVIESGRSLQDVSRDLRRPFPDNPQVYVIGLAKYRSDATLNRLRSDLVQAHGAIPHQFVPIERIQLPASSEPNAWLAELKLLSEPEFENGMSEEELQDWNTRRDRLRRQSTALVDDLFVSAKADTPIKLQAGFAFWPSELAEKGSQADVFFTIASVFQNLRSRAEEGLGRALRADLFQQTLIDPGNFGRFSDGIIQASFLRAARPNELNYSAAPDYSRDMARYARRMIENAGRPKGEAAAELLIAFATDRLRLRSEDYKAVLLGLAKLPPRVESLRRLVVRKLQTLGLIADVDN